MDGAGQNAATLRSSVFGCYSGYHPTQRKESKEQPQHEGKPDHLSNKPGYNLISV